MSELSRRRSSQVRAHARATAACYCDACERVLYVTLEEGLFCPVCSSAVTLAEDIAIDVTSESVVRDF